MNREAVAKELLAIAKELIGTTGTFKCPECGTKVLENTGYCLKCKEKVKKAEDIPLDPQVLADLPRMNLNELAIIIYDDHRKQKRQVNFAAAPYLQAMSSLHSINDMYMQDTGSSIVAYFLSNSNSWKGEVARAVKKELNRRLKSAH